MDMGKIEFEDYGYANGWDKTPERVRLAKADPENDITESIVGDCLHEYRSEKYGFVYKVDTSG